MTKGDLSLSLAISNLRREAEAALTGNVYYLAAQKLIELGEIVNGRAKWPAVASGGPRGLIGFKPALEALRAQIDAELKDNRYYLAAHKLDVIAFVARRAPEMANAASRQAAAPVAALAAAKAPVKSFDDLAAESRRRVEDAASKAPAAAAIQPRSSEPCLACEFETKPSPAPQTASPRAAEPAGLGFFSIFMRAMLGQKA